MGLRVMYVSIWALFAYIARMCIYEQWCFERGTFCVNYMNIYCGLWLFPINMSVLFVLLQVSQTFLTAEWLRE